MVAIIGNGINFRLLSSKGFDRPTIYALQGAVEVAKAVQEGSVPNQSAAEIKIAYESNADTNAYTDAEKDKLGAIESGATGDLTGAEIKTLYEGEADTNAYTDAEKTKLASVEPGATADQTGAEIVSAWEGTTSVNAADLIVKDGSRSFTGPVRLSSYNVAGAPSGSAGDVIYVTDGDGGSPCLAVHNGTNWVRVSLGATISA